MAALLFVLPAVLGLLLPHAAQANDGGNYLLSGQTLDTDGRLTYDQYNFIMQGDCNLVLYNGGWQSNTAKRGKDCTLTLTNGGQLVIRSGSGSTVWSSGPKSNDGKYAAILHPEGKVVVYGPAVWSTHSLSSVNINGRYVFLGNIPLVTNALFSGQILYGDGKLTEKNYVFIMQGDCNLVLYGGNWQSNTHGRGRYCFLRLDHKGELAIKDDSYNTVWNSNARSKEGHYVLILQDDGRAVVYGPDIWSTKPLNSVVTENEGIAMVTGEK